MNEVAEQIARQYRLRTLILRGVVKLPYRVAARMIGPDCAYHLYRHGQGEGRTAGARGHERSAPSAADPPT